MNLKKIIENMDKMPSTLKGFSETPKLTSEQKKKLMDMVGRYNEIGQKLKMENSFIETAQSLAEIANLAETYACNESNDWFAKEVVVKDFKRGKNIAQQYEKLARECYGKVQQLNALYEDMGHILGRYYEIADPMTEVHPNPADIQGQRGLPNAVGAVDEVKPNTSNIKSQRPLPAGGPAPSQVKEVTTNDKNIKSQRNLPAGGPAPKQVKEVAVNTSNLKSQREVPHTNGPATPQVKESTVDERIGVDYSYLKDAIQSFHRLPHQLQTKLTDMIHQQFGRSNLEKGLIEIFKQYGGDFMKLFRQEHPVALESAPEMQVNEVKPNPSNLQSQRELPQGGPESCPCSDPTNPSVPVNPAGAGEMNVKGTREDPQGGPAPKQVKESNTEDSPKSDTGTHGWENGKAWRYDFKTKKRVWDKPDSQVKEVAPNTSNLQSQRRMPSLGDILRMK